MLRTGGASAKTNKVYWIPAQSKPQELEERENGRDVEQITTFTTTEIVVLCTS